MRGLSDGARPIILALPSLPTPPLAAPTVDEPFFVERAQRAPGERRSLGRARLLAERLDLPLADLHPLVVTGSKGKGTAATYAAAALRAAGRSVGLITSPGYRSHRERIRLDGEAIPERDFARLAGLLADAVDRLPAHVPGGGYVSPTGAFTIAGLRWLVDRGCDALVVEAGLGGASDESSLTRPAVVALTEIFEEHLGIIGDDVVEVAQDKAGTICAATHSVLTVPQDPRVGAVIAGAARRHGAALSMVRPTDVPVDLPTDLMRANAALGLRAAAALGAPAGPVPDVRLPGRLSVHRRGSQTWVLDSAINPKGLRAALDWCRQSIGEPTAVLLSIPDTKDRDACLAALPDIDFRLLRVDASHLTFPPGLPLLTDLDAPSLGDLVLAMGTISFVGTTLDLLEVDMTRLF